MWAARIMHFAIGYTHPRLCRASSHGRPTSKRDRSWQSQRLKYVFGNVVLGGGEGDVEALGDLFVGEVLAEEVEDLPFAWGEDVGVGRAAAFSV